MITALSIPASIQLGAFISQPSLAWCGSLQLDDQAIRRRNGLSRAAQSPLLGHLAPAAMVSDASFSDTRRVAP
jgi:hypothetical protein